MPRMSAGMRNRYTKKKNAVGPMWKRRHLCAALAHLPAAPVALNLSHAFTMRSLDQGVREEQHERDDKAVDRQRLHEGKREQQHAAQVVRHLWLPADAINAAARRNALADARAPM